MIAIEISSFGGPEVLRPVERPIPVPGPEEAVIAVEAAGVSRGDVMQRQGKYPPPPGASDIPGLDCAGRIASVGEAVTGWKAGDRVCAVTTGGGYAEFCAVPAAQVMPIPHGWTAVEAVTLPENMFTVYDNLVTRAHLTRGDTVLIHGGTSGIGTTATMLCLAFAAVPVVTAGTDEKCAACRDIGAAEAINYRTQDFVEAARKFTGNRGVDIILDVVGGSYLEKNVDLLATEGRLVIIATQGGRSGNLNILKLLLKRGSIHASSLRPRRPEEKGAIAKRLLRDVWPLLPPKNPIRPIVDSVFPLREAWRAHERMESGSHIGRIVLVP